MNIDRLDDNPAGERAPGADPGNERRKPTPEGKRVFLEALLAEIALYDRQLDLPLDTPAQPKDRFLPDRRPSP